MAKKNRIIIKLISSSGHFYTTYKNKNTKLLIIKKFDPLVNKRNIYKEIKIKKK